MDRFTQGALDALRSYEAMEQRRRSLPATNLPPAPRTPYAGTRAPTMTEQQKKEFDQYVIDNALPF